MVDNTISSERHIAFLNETPDSRLEVSDSVGDLLPQLGVNVAREDVGKGGNDEDIGEGDSLSDDVGLVEEDLV